MAKIERKTVTLSLPADIYEWLAEDGEINKKATDALRSVQTIRRQAELETRGIMTAGMWKALYQSLSATEIDPSLRYSRGGLLALCQDAEVYSHAFSGNGCSVEGLEAVLFNLKGIHIDAICRRVEKAKAHPDIDLDEWAKW